MNLNKWPPLPDNLIILNNIFCPFQFYGWKSFTERPAVYPGSTEWPNCQSYERTEKHEYAAYNFDIEKDTKILASTPLRYS